MTREGTKSAKVLLAALNEPSRVKLQGDGEFGGWLDEAIDAGRLAWPGLALPDSVFLEHLAARVSALPDAADYQGLHTTDLLLACACLHRYPRALDAFAKRYGASMARAMARAGVTGAAAEELVGALRAQGGVHPVQEGLMRDPALDGPVPEQLDRPLSGLPSTYLLLGPDDFGDL